MTSCAGSIGEPMPLDYGYPYPKTTEEQVLEQLKEIKELLRRQDPTSTQPGKHPYAPPCHGNPWCPCRYYGPYWEIPFTVTCGGINVHSLC